MSVRAAPAAAVPQGGQDSEVVLSTASSAVFLTVLPLLLPTGRGAFHKFLNPVVTQFPLLLKAYGANHR